MKVYIYVHHVGKSANLIFSAGWSSRPPSYLGSLSVSTSWKYNMVLWEARWVIVNNRTVFCINLYFKQYSTLPMSIGPISNQLGCCQQNCFQFLALHNPIQQDLSICFFCQDKFSDKIVRLVENHSQLFQYLDGEVLHVHCDTILLILLIWSKKNNVVKEIRYLTSDHCDTA